MAEYRPQWPPEEPNDRGRARRIVLIAVAAVVIIGLGVGAAFLLPGLRQDDRDLVLSAPSTVAPAAPPPVSAAQWKRSGDSLVLSWNADPTQPGDTFRWQRASGDSGKRDSGEVERPEATLAGVPGNARFCVDVTRKRSDRLSDALRTCWPADSPPRSAQPLPADAVVWRYQDQGNWTITTLDLQGGERQRLVTGDDNTSAVVSRDRRTVFYLHRNSETDIDFHAVAADGSEDRKLFSGADADCRRMRRPAVRADGTIAVMCLRPDGEDTLTVLTLEGGRLAELATGYLGDASFSSDGTMLVYTRSRTDNYRDGGPLFRVPVDGSAKPTRILGGTNWNPAFSPSGNQLAFVRIEGDRRSIATVSRAVGDVGPLEPLTDGRGDDLDPSWSPDGRQLAFRRGDGEDSRPYLITIADQLEQRISEQGPVLSPSWTSR